MTYTPSQDPWPSASLPLTPVPPLQPKRRRLGILLGVAAAALIVAVGAGLIFASGLFRHAPKGGGGTSTVDAQGKEACGIAKLMSIGHVDRVSVNAVHDRTIYATHEDLVYRGNELFDTYNTLAIQSATGQLTDAEVQLRLGSPLLKFQTACIQAGFGS